MHRNLNHQINNGHIIRRPDQPYFRSSLRRYIEEKWLTTLVGCIGMIVGVVFIIGNEARAVQISKSLEESISLVTPVLADAEIHKSNIGKLVYLTGTMTIHEPLTEVDYGISVLAVKLIRNVQMYQWVETESETISGDGDIITSHYNYYTDWLDQLVDSSRFANPIGHWNPKEFPIKRQTQINENVKVGKYQLGLDLKKKFKDFITVTSDERPERQDIKLHSGLYYHCQDIWKPEVGDVRIQFSYAGQNGMVVTIVGMLDDTLTLMPYATNAGVQVLILRPGQFSLEDMFALEHSQNKFLTWVYRGAGWLILYLSCICLTTFLQIIVSRSSFLQEILPISHSSLKMTVSICMSLGSTALAWVWYRPVLGVGLIIVTISLLFLMKWFSRDIPQRRYNRL